MFKDLDTIKAQLTELAPAINAFKSEAVQLRILELIFTRRHGGGDDEHLDRDDEPAKPRATRKRKPVRREGTEEESKSAKKRSGATGPVVTLNELVDGGFFTKHRTLAEIIDHCRNSKAKNFRPDQLSGPLARAVRDERLKRQKNSDGQYEYWK